MADLTYKKHRDEGGWGIAPPDPEFHVENGDESVTLEWDVPEKTAVNGQTVCHTEGVVIKRSTASIPKTENDGDLVIKTSDLSGTYEDTGLTNGTTYYYKCFPFSDHEVYNRGRSNGGSATPSHTAKVTVRYTASEAVGGEIKAVQDATTLTALIDESGEAYFELPTTGSWRIGGQEVTVSKLGQNIILNEQMYGYDWKFSESSPEKCITYPAGVDNADFSGCAILGADAEINLGDWEDFSTNFLAFRPVMLNFDGTVREELNRSNQNYTASGASSSVSNSSVTANAMVEFPKRYFKRWTDSNLVAHFRVSRLKLGDDWKCYPWMYGDSEDTAVENDYIYLPMFEGSSVSSKVRSLAGFTPMNTQTGATEWSYIQALGDGWQFDDFSDMAMICDYMFLMGKSTDTQAHWGQGHNSGGSSASNLNTTGKLVTYGPYYGGTGNTNMKFMFMENWYADRWERTFGVWYISNILYVKDFPPYTTDGSVTNYKNLGRAIGGTSGGYISEVTYDEHGLIPKTASGSSTTYVPDGAWFANGTLFLVRGGHCNDGALDGGATFLVSAAFSDSNWDLGPSPAYKKPKTA